MQILLIAEGEDRPSTLADALAAEPGVTVVVARDLDSAVRRLGAEPFDAVVFVLDSSRTDGLPVVRRIREHRPLVPLLVVTPEATVDRAVSFMRAGATDFHPRPTSAGALSMLIRRVLGDSTSLGRPRKRWSVNSARDYLAGDHPRLDAVRAFAEKVARVPNATVLVTGESGTGKSCLARAIHSLSGAGGGFVVVACANPHPSQVELELFGQDGGAFPDGPPKRGLVQTAAGGTLFLDDIGALPLNLQARLLRFLESGQTGRTGGSNASPVAARIIAASNHDLRADVAQGTFRADLLFRLDVASVHMPPLREMPDVVGQLVARFADELADSFRQTRPVPLPAATAELLEYDWPGNVRELRNAVERALIFHEGGPLVVRVPALATAPPDEAAVLMPPGLTLEEVQRRYLLAALRRSQGDYASLASRLGISRKTLWDKRRRLGLDVTANTESTAGERCEDA